MAKQIIHKYEFTPSTRKVKFFDLIRRERILIITNVTTNQIIYSFGDPSFGATAFNQDTTNKTTELTLTFDTTSMSTTDKLQAFIESDSNFIRPDKTYTDPVSKFRVSQPENLIDTDFEYGLQSTKWETLELIKNIPTFFSRNGDEDIDISSITTTANSSEVRVTCAEDHNLVQGNPIIVQGTSKSTANGGFVVTRIISSTIFTYQAKAPLADTQEIKETYTQIFLGSIYQGTEFKLENLNGIVTDNATPSKLTVNTQFPLGLSEDTSLFLTNSVGQKVVNFTGGSAYVIDENFANIGTTTDNNASTGETQNWNYGAVNPHNYLPIQDATKGLIVKWFVQGTDANKRTITLNTAGGVETITFLDGPHGFTDGMYVVYWHGYGNGALGGLTDTRPYWVRVVDNNTIYLTLGGPTSTARVNLSSYGSFNGVSRSCFVRAFDPVQAFTSSSSEQLRFNTEVPLIANDRNQRVIMNYTTTGGLPYMNNSNNLTAYGDTSGQILFTKNVSVVNGETRCQFAYTPNGSTRNINSGTVNGAMVLIQPDPTANSIWFIGHGLKNTDVIRFGSSSSTVPTGLTRNQYYRPEVVNNNRIRFQQYNSTSIRNLTSQGSYTATLDITGFTAVKDADTILAQQTITASPTTTNYAVSVDAKSGGGGNAFYIDGVEAPALALTEGNTYIFNQDNATNFGHLLRFSETADGVNGGGSAYTTGVTEVGTPGNAGAYTQIVVATGAPSLYYYCINHAGMGGAITTPAPSSTTSGHGLDAGDAVVYTDEGNTTIGALTNGVTYYVQNPTTNKLQLSTGTTGYETPDITFRHSTGGSQTTGYIYSFSYIRRTSHGFSTGDRVQYTSNTPVGGLTNNAFYFVRRINSSYFYLYRTLSGAQTGTGWSDRILFSYPYSGTGRLRKTNIVDISSEGAGAQKFTANIDGASDGVYKVDNRVNSTSFEMNASGQIPTRQVQFDASAAVWTEQDALRIPNHYFRTGFAVTYSTSNTVTGGLTSGTTYYVIRVSRNWIRLAASEADAEANTYITLTSRGSGLASLSTSTIIGEILGQGTASIENEAKLLSGTNTNFSSFFKTGDDISLYKPETFSTKTVSALDTGNNRVTATSHGYSAGDAVIYEASTAATGLTSGYIYYVSPPTTSTLSFYPTAADATGGTNIIALSGSQAGATVKKITSTGDTLLNSISKVLSPTKIELEDAATEALADIEYSVGTSLILRSDGFALHRPYDGGVELIPSSNPDSQMIRQTRKYFRYQSGKGIQVSFAVNFSPTTQIERIVTTGSTTATIHSKFPHRLSVGLNVSIHDAPSISGTDYFNGTFAVSAIPDEYSFQVTLASTPPATSTGGYSFFYVENWQNSNLRCGLFDDQNGMFFEYDGQNLKVCRRKSIKQLSGSVTATFGSGQISGVNTKFQSQLNVGEYVVIRGQSYMIVQIDSDTTCYITPSYRGKTASNIIVTLTENIKVSQANWNVDVADGTGPTGYNLDIHKIQMAYIDYSWYGAGKIRFGFKDQNGDVQYVHQFTHNNLESEAYMRSGNVPARYDLQNIGTPTYVPALAHWGTSVIMDGRFDDDKAYIFTASSNEIQVTGSASVTVTGKSAYQYTYYGLEQNRLRRIGNALEINQNSLYNQLSAGMEITGANLATGTKLRNPYDNRFTATPYQPDINSSQGYSYSGQQVRNLLVLDRNTTGTSGSNSSYTVTLSGATTPVVYDIPIISIRLAPSVDTGTIGALGEREIINRMQLILNSCGIITTHAAEITLKLNGSVDNATFTGVTNPSLSQLVYHGTGDSIVGGVDLFKFRVQGGVGTSGRTPIATEQTLGEVASLGNAIQGGDNTYPDGPDILTVVARLTEDPSNVSTSNPFSIASRISWSESQA